MNYDISKFEISTEFPYIELQQKKSIFFLKRVIEFKNHKMAKSN